MKHTAIKISLGLILFLIACVTSKKVTESRDWYYIENKLDFFDPYSNANDFNAWIRNSRNIKIAHETFKKIGYYNLVDSFDLYSNPCMIWGYVNKPCNEIIDSLIITYKLDSIPQKYYREFWMRRKNEQNDKIVFDVLEELNDILYKKIPISYNDELTNDTIYRLALITLPDSSLTNQKALIDFDYLREIGLHSSAYNLLFESYKYQDLNINRDSLVLKLKKDTINCCPHAFLIDDTK